MVKFFLMLFLLIITATDGAAINELKTENDTIEFLRELARSESFKGQKLSKIRLGLDKMGIPIRYFVLDGTSPWIDEKRKSYVNRVFLSFLTMEDMRSRIGTNRTKGIVLSIVFEEPYNIEVSAFEKEYGLEEDDALTPMEKLKAIEDKFTIMCIMYKYVDFRL